MSAVRRTVAVALALLLTAGTAWLSRVPVRFSAPDDGLLRLSWRIEGVTVEACRQRTPEELAELPVHMRNPQACIGGLAPYLLYLTVDGAILSEDTFHAAGARQDRPVFVLRDVPLAPGRHEVEVRFQALIPEGVEPSGQGIRELNWSGTVTLEGREVALLTLAGSGRALEIRLP